MPNRTEARPAKASFTNATGRLPLLRLFSTPLKPPQRAIGPIASSQRDPESACSAKLRINSAVSGSTPSC
jgi:hypothetical protein